MTDESIFAAAVAIPDPAGRAAYLDRACAGNPALRREVEELLAAHTAAGSFLAAPPAPTPTDPYVEPDRVGGRVGLYKLLQKIGEGGMGVVYMADQEEPVRRRVALKVIKPGMDSRTVLARFEAERQALALMDHPNIAKVLDAGATPDGRPFVVMELVKGVPITRFADDNKLTPRERLELFVPVCQAIQHAHQKGVIHRDVKPSNVLVTLYDGRPVPKVIDFGIAKATAQQLTERTLFTEYGALVGTPEYMAPEQAELNALDVDTRADIYSLGVMLYELLTGTTPLDRKRVRAAGYAEMLRLIKEEEAPRPSARLTARRDALASVSAQRQTDPAKLTRLVRGELDWIVMKALEKDRSRRYETANGFAADVCRYLAGEPVQAVPPTVGYRLRKFARKNRGPVLVGGVVAGLLVAATVVSLGLAAWARQAEADARAATERALAERAAAEEQRQRAERREAEARESERKARAAEAAARESDASAQAVLKFVEENVFAAPDPFRAKDGPGREVTLRQALDAAEPKITAAFAARPRVEARLRHVLGTTYRNLGGRDLSLPQFERAHALAREHYGPDDEFTIRAEGDLAQAYANRGRTREAYALLESALARRRQALGPEHRSTLQTISNLIAVYVSGGPRQEDRSKLLTELASRLDGWAEKNFEGITPLEMFRLWKNLGVIPLNGPQFRQFQFLEAGMPGIARDLGPDDDEVLELSWWIARGYIAQWRYGEAFPLAEATYRRVIAKHGHAHDLAYAILRNLPIRLAEAGRPADGARMLEEALPELRRLFGPGNSLISPHVINLSYVYLTYLGRHRQAVELIQTTLAAVPETDRRTYQNYDFLLRNLADAYYKLGDVTSCRRAIAETVAWYRAKYAPDDLELAQLLVTIGADCIDMREYAEAEKLVREVLTVREAQQPDGWPTFGAKALVGMALVWQKRYAEAEPLLAAGYEGLVARREAIPPSSRYHIVRAGSWLALLYDRTGRPDRAAAVRSGLPPEEAPRPRPVKP